MTVLAATVAVSVIVAALVLLAVRAVVLYYARQDELTIRKMQADFTALLRREAGE